MSIKIALDELFAAIGERGQTAFVCTVSDPAATHLSHVAVLNEGGHLRCEVGRTSRANAAERPAVVVLWPSRDPQDFSLIVDGVATVEGESLVIRPTAAVLHRPAPRDGE